MNRGLSKNAIQTIAVFAMLTDHFSVFFSNTPYYYLMRFFGRITIIIMSYFVAEGYHKTHNLSKYILRLGIFAAISQIPYWLFVCHGQIPSDTAVLLMSVFRTRNVIFTLFVGLCVLTIVKADYGYGVKLFALSGGLYLVRNSDWSCFGLLWVVGFGVLYPSRSKQLVWAAIVLAAKILGALPMSVESVINAGALTYGMLDTLVMLGGFMAIPLLMCYNGKKGRGLRYGFYVLYPLQFLVILAIKFI